VRRCVSQVFVGGAAAGGPAPLAGDSDRPDHQGLPGVSPDDRASKGLTPSQVSGLDPSFLTDRTGLQAASPPRGPNGFLNILKNDAIPGNGRSNRLISRISGVRGNQA